MKNLLPYCLLVCCLTLSSCGVKSVAEEKTEESSCVISVVNWNVQTFFDAETSGNEYSEFQSQTRWSKDKYVERLKRLVEVMEVLNADVFVFEEIENVGVLYDISNQLAKKSWDCFENWNYGAFTIDDTNCIGIGILSKFPLENVKIHKMDIRCQKTNQPSTRPVLEVTVLAKNKKLIILANHWKSKSGGESLSEIWRDWQECNLSNILLSGDCDANYLICGDFNRDCNDFVTDFSENSFFNENTLLRSINIDTKEPQKVMVYNPWFDSKGQLQKEIGSYYFQKNWERIDNFFSYGNTKLSNFCVKSELPWCDESNIPKSYKINTGEGYSDHIPIMTCVVLK